MLNSLQTRVAIRLGRRRPQPPSADYRLLQAVHQRRETLVIRTDRQLREEQQANCGRGRRPRGDR